MTYESTGMDSSDVEQAPLAYQVLSGILAISGLAVGHSNFHTLGEGNYMVSFPGSLHSLSMISHCLNYGVQPVAHLPNLFVGKAGDVTVFVLLASEDGKTRTQLTCCVLSDHSLEPLTTMARAQRASGPNFADTLMHG